MAANYTLQAAGLMVDEIELGRLIRCRTVDDKGGSKSGWYFGFDDGGVSYGDWRSGQISHWQPNGGKPDWQAVEQVKREREIAQKVEWEANAKRLTATWSNSIECASTGLISRYLQSRGLALVPNLRGAQLPYWYDGQLLGNYPAMLAMVQVPAGHIVNIHRTFLKEDGAGKADVPIQRKLMGSAGRMMGAAIRLIPHKTRLGIAEGIETALSASVLFDVPCWAAVSAHGLASWQPPEEVMTVDIFSDNDSNGVGQEAASRLAQRLATNGLEVRIQTPELIGDWNDVLMESGK